MAQNDLRISISAMLNMDQSITEINRNITQLEQKVNALKLKITVDQSSLTNFQQSLNTIASKQQNVAKSTQQTTTQINNMATATKNAGNHTMSFGEQLNIAFSRTMVWTTATTAIYGTIHALQAMTQEIILVDDAMTELKRVMNEAPETYNQLLSESIELSKELGNNVHDVLATISGFARAGDYTKNQLLDLAKTATIASNVSDLTPEQAMNDMIATMNVFKIEATDTMSIIDKMNEVDNNFAVSTRQISEAMSKASGVAAQFGVSIDELIGDITSISSVTFESGNIIGRALKTIYSRITTMDGVEGILNSIGISIKNMNGDNRDVSDILSDVRGKWDSLSKAQQQNIAVTLAGRDHLTRFIAMMRSTDIAVAATETSINSQGSALRENEKYLESMTAQINKLKSSFTEMSVAVGNNGLGQTFMAIVKSLTFMANGLTEFTNATKGLNIILPLVAAGVFGIVKAFTALRVAATGAKLSLGWIGLGVIALEGLTTAAFGASKAYGETVDTLLDASNKYTQSADRLDLLVRKYDELKPQAETSASAQEELNNVLDEINRIAPNVIENTDKYGNSLEVNKEKAEQFADSLRKMSDEQLASASIQVNTDYTKAKNDLDNLIIKKDEVKKEVSEMYDFMLEYQDKYQVVSMAEAGKEFLARSAEMTGKELRDASNEFGKYNLIMSKHASDMEKYGNIIKDVDNKQAEVDGLKSQQQQIQFLTSDYQKLSETVKQTFDGKIDSSIYGNFDKSQMTALVDFGNKVKDNSANIENYIPILEKAKISQEQIDEVVKGLTETIILNAEAMGEEGVQIQDLGQSLKDAQGNFEALSGIVQQLARDGEFDTATTVAQKDAYEALASELEPINGLLETMAEGKAISAAEAMDLIAKEDELASAISFENGQLVINKEAVLNLRDSKINSYNDMLTAVQTEATQTANATLANLNNYGLQIAAIQNLQDAKRALAEMEGAQRQVDSGRSGWEIRDNVQDTAGQKSSAIASARTAVSNLANLMQNVDRLKGMAGAALPQVGTKAASPSKNKAPKEKKPKKEKDVEIYQLDQYKMKMDELNNVLEQSEFIQKRLDKGSAEYRKELEKQSSTLNEMSAHTLGQIGALEQRNKVLNSQISSMGDANRLSNDQKEILNALRKELEQNASEVNNLRDAWRGYQDQLVSMQQDIRDQISETIAEEEAKRIEILEAEIEEVNKLYEDQIKLKQDELDMLDEIIEKEDRIKTLREKNNEILKVRSDERYSYITEEGEEILTFNRQQVSELEKERDEMLEQYERDDIKKALDDEIKRLEKQKDNAEKQLRQRLDDFKKFWDQMVKDAKSGTLSYSTLIQAWQDTSISSLRNHVNGTGAELAKLGGLFNSLTVVQNNMDAVAKQINSSLSAVRNSANSILGAMGGDVSNGINGIADAARAGFNNMINDANNAGSKLGTVLEATRKKYEDFVTYYNNLFKTSQGDSVKYLEAEKLAMRQYSGLVKYHDGGVVGNSPNRLGELANKLFNAKPNEQVVMALKDELMIPSHNIPNLFTNIGNMVNSLTGKQPASVDQSKHINIQNMTVKSNNPMEFFNGLDNALRSQ